MRRHHARAGDGARRAPRASSAKTVSASASSTTRAPRGERRQRRRARPGRGAGAGADQDGVAPGIGEQCGEIRRRRDRLHDDAGERRGIDRPGGFRRRQRDEAGADARRGARREPRRPGHHRAAGDQRMAAAIFMRLELRPGIGVEPQRRTVLNASGAPSPPARASGCRYRRARTSPRERASGQQQMAGLLAEEGHRHGRRRRGAAHRAGGAVEPARHVDGDDRQPARRHRLDRRARRALDRRATGRRRRSRRSTSPAPCSSSGPSGSTGTAPQRGVMRGIARSRCGRRAGRAAPASRRRRDGAPRRSRRRHCCRGRTAPRPGAATSARSTVSATARPAVSISSAPAMPPAIAA